MFVPCITKVIDKIPKANIPNYGYGGGVFCQICFFFGVQLLVILFLVYIYAINFLLINVNNVIY